MQAHKDTQTLTHAHTRGAHPNFMAASCVDLLRQNNNTEEEILSDSFLLALSPFTLSLDALFARVCNATCLWLLMTTATLYSPVLLTHLSTLMNHLYSASVYLFSVYVYMHLCMRVC